MTSTVSWLIQQCPFHDLHFRGKEEALDPTRKDRWVSYHARDINVHKSLNNWNARDLATPKDRKHGAKQAALSYALLPEFMVWSGGDHKLWGGSTPQPGKQCSRQAQIKHPRATPDTPVQGHLPCTAQTRRWPCRSGHRGYHQWPSQPAVRRSGSPLPGSSAHTSDCPWLPKKKNTTQ